MCRCPSRFLQGEGGICTQAKNSAPQIFVNISYYFLEGEGGGGEGWVPLPRVVPAMVELVAFFFIRLNDLYILFVHN